MPQRTGSLLLWDFDITFVYKRRIFIFFCPYRCLDQARIVQIEQKTEAKYYILNKGFMNGKPCKICSVVV